MMIIAAAVFFETVLNLSLWRFVFNTLKISSFSDLIFALSMPVFVFIGIYMFFNIFILPKIYKPILIFLLIISSISNYMMYQYSIFIDSDMMRNVFETNRSEILEYFNLNGMIWFIISGVLPSVFILKSKVIFNTVRYEARNRLLGAAVFLSVLALIAVSNYKEYVVYGRNNRQITRLINPSNYIYGTYRYFQRKHQSQKKFTYLDENIRLVTLPDKNITVFVIVIGETARTMNFSLNGYERTTNPVLAEEDVISYQDVTASGTSTAVSLPAMFSGLPKSKFKLDEAQYTQNLTDFISQAGYMTVWLENDSGCKNVCGRTVYRDITSENNPDFCSGSQCFDEVLLEPLEKILAEAKEDTVIFLHTIGSHGPSYYKRYPEEFKVFQPACETSDIQNCRKEEIVNTYDNTIVYTDYILGRVIGALKKYPDYESGLLYISDHGESLGERGIYLHGLPMRLAPREQLKVPMILWLSETMKKNDLLNYSCLKNKSAEPYSHDFFFHSLISLLEIKTKIYDPDFDLFASCRDKKYPSSFGLALAAE
jgi:lipid A ethanolaminephosphotransferase